MRRRPRRLTLSKETVQDLSPFRRAGGGVILTLLQCTYICTYGNGYACSAYCPTQPVTTVALTCNQD